MTVSSGCQYLSDFTDQSSNISNSQSRYPTISEIKEIPENAKTDNDYVSLVEWNEKVSPDYYLVAGPAEKLYEVEPGEYLYFETDNQDRTVGAVANITQEDYFRAKKTERANINNLYPSGWTKNVEVTIPATENSPAKDYNGWFYNRSHLIADSLGGHPQVENLITGTRTQNVGNSNHKGGMKYPEQLAYDYLSSSEAKYCPLYYAAIPQYQTDDELVPRTVTVDIQSCNKSLDEHIIVYNVAKGFAIDYTTGEFFETN